MARGRTTELPYLNELLAQAGSSEECDRAIDAFNDLCRLGCDRQGLGYLLAWYSIRNPIKLSRGSTIHIHPLDSWETALDPKDGKPPITRPELERISKRALRLLSDIKRLIRTPIVRQLVLQGDVVSEDLLGGGPSPRTGVFQGLIRLPGLVKRFGPRNKPDRTRTLVKICQHIQRSTGGYRDERLADILNVLMPHDKDNPTTGTAIKQWRKRHAVIGKRGTQRP